VTVRRYGTSSEYVRELIRRDQDRQHLRQLLLDEASSSPTSSADDQYFVALRNRARGQQSGLSPHANEPCGMSKALLITTLARLEWALRSASSTHSNGSTN
jgi:antitoxin ParD1/3/4